MIDYERIGRAIRVLRGKVGYTQQELADRLYVSKMAVSKWERGKSIPDVETLRRLSVVLDMDVDGLIDGTATYLDKHWKGVLVMDGAARMICDKPAIDYLISYFLLAGVRDILVSASQDDCACIERRFRGGEALGINLRFVPPDLTPADLSETYAEWLEQSSIMLISKPFFIYGVNLTRFIQRAMQHRKAVVSMAVVVGKEAASPLFADKSLSHYDYRPIPLYFLRPKVFLQSDRPDSFDECFGDLARKDSVLYETLDKGFVFAPMAGDDTLEQIASLVRIVQEMSNCVMYCPLEIAWRRGMISREEMNAEATGFSEYSRYIETL